MHLKNSAPTGQFSGFSRFSSGQRLRSLLKTLFFPGFDIPIGLKPSKIKRYKLLNKEQNTCPSQTALAAKTGPSTPKAHGRLNPLDEPCRRRALVQLAGYRGAVLLYLLGRQQSGQALVQALDAQSCCVAMPGAGGKANGGPHLAPETAQGRAAAARCCRAGHKENAPR